MTVLNFPSVESEWIQLCYGTKDEACHSVPWGPSFSRDASCPGGCGPVLGQNFGRKNVLFCFFLWLFEGVDKKLKEGSFGGWGWVSRAWICSPLQSVRSVTHAVGPESLVLRFLDLELFSEAGGEKGDHVSVPSRQSASPGVNGSWGPTHLQNYSSNKRDVFI